MLVSLGSLAGLLVVFVVFVVDVVWLEVCPWVAFVELLVAFCCEVLRGFAGMPSIAVLHAAPYTQPMMPIKRVNERIVNMVT